MSYRSVLVNLDVDGPAASLLDFAVDLAGRALDTQVQLMRALGGGFEPDADTARLAARNN